MVKKKIIVNITKADIENGIKLTSKYCPIALAAKRAFKSPLISVLSLTGIIKSYPTRKSHYYELPNKATDFIWDFDRGHDVKPFRFTTWRV